MWKYFALLSRDEITLCPHSKLLFENICMKGNDIGNTEWCFGDFGVGELVGPILNSDIFTPLFS